MLKLEVSSTRKYREAGGPMQHPELAAAISPSSPADRSHATAPGVTEFLNDPGMLSAASHPQDDPGR